MKKINMEDILCVVNANLKDSTITLEEVSANLVELGIDSITFIQIIVSIEEAFECEIPDSKLLISEMDTVQKIYNVLQELYKEQS